jgi:hypothetical protein
LTRCGDRSIIPLDLKREKRFQVRSVRKSERTGILRTDLAFTFEPAWNGHFLIGMELNRSAAPIIRTINENWRREEIEFSIPEAAEIIVWETGNGRERPYDGA